MTIVWVALWAVTYCELIIDPGPSFEPTHLRKKRSKKGCAAKYRLFLPSNLFSFPALFVSTLFSWLVFTYPWLLSDTWPSDSLRFTFTSPQFGAQSMPRCSSRSSSTLLTHSRPLPAHPSSDCSHCEPHRTPANTTHPIIAVSPSYMYSPLLPFILGFPENLQ